MDEEETKALEKCLSPSSEHKCQHCLEIEKRSSQHPIEVRLNFWKELYEKQLVVIVDTNIIIEYIDMIIKLLGCNMDGHSPIVYIPFIVIKELESIKKDKSNRNPILSKKCFDSSKILENEMRVCTRIVEQSLESMKKCRIINFKQKDADDCITECCITLKKSGHNVVLWSEDRNLRIKVLGHHILSIRTQEIKEMIDHETKNPLRALMLDNEIILAIMGLLKNAPQELIQKMLNDPKNALMILMEKKEGLPTNNEPDEDSINPENRLTLAASLDDFNLVNLFED